MSYFFIVHPRDPKTIAKYGIDKALGIFVEIRAPGKRKTEYDQLHSGYNDLTGALEFFIAHGFFSEDALVDAKVWLEDEGGEGRVASDVHRAATVICNFKEWSPPFGSVLDAEKNSGEQVKIATSSKYTVSVKVADNERCVQIYYPEDTDCDPKDVMYDLGKTESVNKPVLESLLGFTGFDGMEWRHRAEIVSNADEDDPDDPEEDFACDPDELAITLYENYGFRPLPSWLALHPEVPPDTCGYPEGLPKAREQLKNG